MPANVISSAALQLGRAVLNMCMPYSSHDEIAVAVEETVHDALVEGRIE